jgi:hypothetical protein
VVFFLCGYFVGFTYCLKIAFIVFRLHPSFIVW